VRVLAFTKYGREAASTRYRLLQFLPALREAGITVDWRPLLGDQYVRGLVTGRRASVLSTAGSYGRRLRDRASARDADLIWVYAELLPYVPAWLERLALPAGKPLVVDWDDAFHVPYAEHRSGLARWLLGTKFETVLGQANVVTCGNTWLEDYAARFCPRTMVAPTVVDTDQYRPAAQEDGGEIVIGWIGSPTTWPNVRPLLPLLRRLHERHGTRVRAVGAGLAAEDDLFPGLDLVPWSEATEVQEVKRFTIGIMPLLDLPFQRGKSGFKLIQYMACGLPVVGSPVGVNSQIIDHGENGFLATDPGEWGRALERLIAVPDLRGTLGENGRRKAVERYSLRSEAPRLVELFRSLVP
jgi:glycosyltransferase involved in cell wall biosynthesis